MVQHDLMHQTIQYIEKHLQDDLSLEHLSHRAGYSKSHFQKSFKQSTGINVYQYIKRRRLISASKLLVFTDLRILDIAYLFHFGSHEAFSRAFYAQFEMTRTHFRTHMKSITQRTEIPHMESLIHGWTFTVTDIDRYQISKDYRESNQSQYSIKLNSLDDDISASNTHLPLKPINLELL